MTQDSYTCPTLCDDDCLDDVDGDVMCHERHVPRWKWVHDPDECERRQADPA